MLMRLSGMNDLPSDTGLMEEATRSAAAPGRCGA
jgi:hypothetical protein